VCFDNASSLRARCRWLQGVKGEGLRGRPRVAAIACNRHIARFLLQGQQQPPSPASASKQPVHILLCCCVTSASSLEHQGMAALAAPRARCRGAARPGQRCLTACRHSHGSQCCFNLDLTGVALHGMSSSTAAVGALHLMTLCLQRRLGEHGMTKVPAIVRNPYVWCLTLQDVASWAAAAAPPPGQPQPWQQGGRCSTASSGRHPRHHHTAFADPGVVTAVCVQPARMTALSIGLPTVAASHA
jgi:hypothetical protein